MRSRPGQLRALVTNDDGVSSEGLRRLALLARDAGLAVVVAAPLVEASGAGAALTAVERDGRVLVEERVLDGLDDVPVYGVAALPAFITLIALRGAFGPPPELVLSGINRGLNTGQAVLHSGTVGAALTAASHGCRAMAVSAMTGPETHWQTAVEVAADVVPLLLESDRPMVLNINTPNLPSREVRGRRRAGLARFGAVRMNISEVDEGYVRVSVTGIDRETEPGSDLALLREGYATITPLRPVSEATDLPLALGPEWDGPSTREAWRRELAEEMFTVEADLGDG